jgi:hypothetical protein
MNDIAAALTDSLPRNGTAPMNGPLAITDGTVGQPGLSFSANSATGIRRDVTGPTVNTVVNGQDMLGVGPHKISTPALLSSPALKCNADNEVTITVNNSTGVTEPTDPIQGDPFNTLANAIAYANTLAAPITVNIVLTSGQVHLVDTDLQTLRGFNLRSSTRGVKVTLDCGVVPKIFTVQYGINNIEDVAFDNLYVEGFKTHLAFTNCSLSVDNHKTNALFCTQSNVSLSNTPIVKGGLYMHHGSICGADTLTLNDGVVLISTSSSLIILGATSIRHETAGADGYGLKVTVNSCAYFYDDFTVVTHNKPAILCELSSTVNIGGTYIDLNTVNNAGDIVSVLLGSIVRLATNTLYTYTSGGTKCFYLGLSSTLIVEATTWDFTDGLTSTVDVNAMGQLLIPAGELIGMFFAPSRNVEGTNLNKWVTN